jgi:Holliday junction resolvase RusA-like endonuclease
MIKFIIPGPAVGKERHRTARLRTKRGREFLHHYTPAKTANYEAAVGLIARAAVGPNFALLTGPVAIGMEIGITPPASWSAKKRAQALAGDIWPTVKPDVSNVAKAIEDGLNQVIYDDDAKIVMLLVAKCYAERAYVKVWIDQVENCDRIVTAITTPERGVFLP